MINERQYVPHGTNTMGNGKIMELVAEHGMEGYGIYWMLMEHLQQQKDGKSNLKIIRILSKKMRVSPQKLNKILNDFALFSVENDEVSSPELNEKRTVLEAKHKKLSEAGHKGYEAKTLKNKDNASSQAQASLYNNITTTDNNINNNSSSNRIKIQGWEEAIDGLAHEQVWCEYMAMRSGLEERFKQQYPEIIAFFKQHIISYGKEDTIHSLSDAKNYFSNFIVPGKPPHQQLLEKLNKAKENDPYRFEDISPDGKRSYYGLPIPADAPPRPNANAHWSGEDWE